MDLEILWLEYQQSKKEHMPLKGEQFCWDKFEELFHTAEKYQKALTKIAFYNPIEVMKGPLEYDRMVKLFQEMAIRALEK